MDNSSATLLVVDDNDDNRYTLTRRLNREGYTNLLIAVDGRHALEVLRQKPVDLVLLDIMMPELNGFQVLEQMRADERLRGIPVIMISAVDEFESVVRCIELGAEDYLPKPFNATLLRARVSSSLERKRLADEVAHHAARMEEDLNAARAIQLGMVPALFPLPAPDWPLDIHAALIPAREVGGDLYDFFEDGAGNLCIAMADVSGKGAGAALFMARTKTLIHTVARLLPATGTDVRPDAIMKHVNDELCRDNPTSMFVTLFFGVVNIATRTLHYCNAGHNIPFLVTASGDCRRVSGARGLVLGAVRGFAYRSAAHALSAGDCLFCYTDGITEAENGNGEFFDELRLEAILRRTAGASARDIVAATIAGVGEFAGQAPQSDDIAALAVRLVG
ncbi:MAG: SpoIIE family protein phosphatase [Betaproteobacteria bacterium]